MYAVFRCNHYKRTSCADKIIVPVQSEYLAANGRTHLIKTVDKVRRQINPKLKVAGILLTLVDKRTSLATDVKELQEAMPPIYQYIQERVRTYKENKNVPNSTAVSSADEIKKFKELLDMGAITQEEFDNKKKELLK